MSTIEIPELELEEACWHCHGQGKKTLVGPPCDFCNGKGWVPTSDGLKVMEFLNRHWRSV